MEKDEKEMHKIPDDAEILEYLYQVIKSYRRIEIEAPLFEKKSEKLGWQIINPTCRSYNGGVIAKALGFKSCIMKAYDKISPKNEKAN